MAMSDIETGNNGSTAEDNAIIEKLKRGEPVAVTEPYTTYFYHVFAMVYNRVDRDRDAAQDIVQETFLAASKSLGKFNGRSKLYTWLYSIAYKKLVDYYRRRKREAKRQNEVRENYAVEAAQASGDGSTVESEEEARVVRETMSDLPMHYREVLLLKYVEEMSVVEIGQIMGRSSKSVEGLLSRARKELRDKLAIRNEG